MHKSAVPCLAALITLLSIPAVLAQEPAPAPKPGPEHEKLAYFIGTWKSEADVKPTAFGPGGNTPPRKPAIGSQANSLSSVRPRAA